MSWHLVLLGFAAGLVIGTVTTPVGVSGAVFLLPVQLDVLREPSPAVTPTNLLFNLVATPAALRRYRAQGQLAGPLARQLIAATLPGVVIGPLVRVFLVPAVRAFRLIAAAVLLPLGAWLCVRSSPRSTCRCGSVRPLSTRTITVLALLVGAVGGIYGIGGGSILGPILVGAGLPVATVAPAALASTFATSAVGAITYGLLAVVADGSIAPAARAELGKAGPYADPNGWCHLFVNYVAEQAKVPGWQSQPSPSLLYADALADGRLSKSPVVGGIAFIDFEENFDEDGYVDHVGIVESATEHEGDVVTLERNPAGGGSDVVVRHSRSVLSPHIIGYATLAKS